MTLEEAQALMNKYYELAEYYRKLAIKIRNEQQGNQSNPPQTRQGDS